MTVNIRNSNFEPLEGIGKLCRGPYFRHISSLKLSTAPIYWKRLFWKYSHKMELRYTHSSKGLFHVMKRSYHTPLFQKSFRSLWLSDITTNWAPDIMHMCGLRYVVSGGEILVWIQRLKFLKTSSALVPKWGFFVDTRLTFCLSPPGWPFLDFSGTVNQDSLRPWTYL